MPTASYVKVTSANEDLAEGIDVYKRQPKVRPLASFMWRMPSATSSRTKS